MYPQGMDSHSRSCSDGRTDRTNRSKSKCPSLFHDRGIKKNYLTQSQRKFPAKLWQYNYRLQSHTTFLPQNPQGSFILNYTHTSNKEPYLYTRVKVVHGCRGCTGAGTWGVRPLVWDTERHRRSLEYTKYRSWSAVLVTPGNEKTLYFNTIFLAALNRLEITIKWYLHENHRWYVIHCLPVKAVNTQIHVHTQIKYNS